MEIAVVLGFVVGLAVGLGTAFLTGYRAGLTMLKRDYDDAKVNLRRDYAKFRGMFPS